MAQRFYNLVLLPRVRDDIAEYKRLNFHLYSALKKALFKPGAWFKGETESKGYILSFSKKEENSDHSVMCECGRYKKKCKTPQL